MNGPHSCRGEGPVSHKAEFISGLLLCIIPQCNQNKPFWKDKSNRKDMVQAYYINFKQLIWSSELEKVNVLFYRQ